MAGKIINTLHEQFNICVQYIGSTYKTDVKLEAGKLNMAKDLVNIYKAKINIPQIYFSPINMASVKISKSFELV